MASIGGINCDLMEGSIKPKTERVAAVELIGANAPAIQLLGKAEGTCRLTVVVFGSLNLVESWAASIFALRGTIVSIVDARGTDHPNYLIQGFGELKITAAEIPGSTTTHRGELLVTGLET